MTVTKVIENLERTIKGKKLLLDSYKGNDLATAVANQFLQMNIEELEKIRADLEAALYF